MKRILRHPAINAVGISLFTAFYGLVFLTASNNFAFGKQSVDPFWQGWSSFLTAGYHAYIAYGLIAITILVVALLILRRRPYDEYHTSLLIHCLAVAAVLTLVAIAIFYLMILCDPSSIMEKFTLFIVIHWTTVVLCDLTYVLLCRWR